MNSALGAQEGQHEPKLALNWAQVGPSWIQSRPKLALSWLQGGSSPVSQVISCEAAAEINANQRAATGTQFRPPLKTIIRGTVSSRSAYYYNQPSDRRRSATTVSWTCTVALLAGSGLETTFDE